MKLLEGSAEPAEDGKQVSPPPIAVDQHGARRVAAQQLQLMGLGVCHTLHFHGYGILVDT